MSIVRTTEPPFSSFVVGGEITPPPISGPEGCWLWACSTALLDRSNGFVPEVVDTWSHCATPVKTEAEARMALARHLRRLADQVEQDRV